MDLKPMGAAGLTQGSLVWRHWLAFCTAHGVVWDAAQSADIARFCQAIGPRSSLKKTSPVTRRRYWRVLRDLYAHALAVGLVALSVPMWAALHKGLYEGFPGGDDFKARRYRLALLLMMRAALTVREIIGLTLDNAQPCSESAGTPLLYTLRVRKAGGGHERALQLDPETSRALHAWLAVRPLGLPALHPGSRLVVGDRIGRAVAPNGLYNICQVHLARCLVHADLLAAPGPHTTVNPGALAHMGPNTLRNTCIAGWFNAGVPLQEIQRRCCFKDASVMSRLGAHLSSPLPL